MENELREQRRKLVREECNTYNPNYWPGSSEWMRNKAAQDALRTFDLAHPELAAKIAAEAVERRRARMAANLKGKDILGL